MNAKERRAFAKYRTYRAQIEAAEEVLSGTSDLMPMLIPKNLSAEKVHKLKLSAFAGMVRPKGRPRKDKARARIRDLKKSGLSWTKIAKQMNVENPGAEYTQHSVRMAAK